MDRTTTAHGPPRSDSPADLRGLVDSRETPAKTVAATMRRVVEYFEAEGEIAGARLTEVRAELELLDEYSVETVAVRRLLVSEELSPRGFMALMANIFVRVLPTYAEIPLNLALHGAHGDLRNYGLIALNVNDEAGEGDPKKTHPALFNRSAGVFSGVFDVPPISIRIGLAALVLRLHEEGWRDVEEGLALAQKALARDDNGAQVAKERLLADFEVARQYSALIAAEAIECYRWRMHTLAELVSDQLSEDSSRDGYLILLSLLAVREAAASDPQGIFHSLSALVARYGGHLGEDVHVVADALCWSDVHIDGELGKQAGYVGHSVEEDHAEQALGAVLDHLHDDRGLLRSLSAMNTINRHLRDLWHGTVRVIEEQPGDRIPVNRIPDEVHRRVRLERLGPQASLA